MKTCKKCGAQFDGRRCPPCHRAINALYVLNNRDKVLAARKAFRDANAYRLRLVSANYRAINAEKVRMAKARYAAANSQKIVAKVAAWREANPDAHRVHSHNRRAKLRENGGRLSRGLAAKLFELQRVKCACCGLPLGDDYQMDHIMPIALGGANEDSNIQLLRGLCNSQKTAKHPIDFMQRKGFLL